ncbi:Electron transport complex subunit RsxC,partial [Serratia symbiotica]|nr:Electron transport complex subunit RsxC,partial [Serratia symbiotica]
MFNFFNTFTKNKIWNFKGGIHPPEMKIQSYNIPLRRIPLPKIFIVPLQQHLGLKGDPCISVGDKVLKGQALSLGKKFIVPIHSPTSGIIHSIQPHLIASSSKTKELCIIIKSDGKDNWCNLHPILDYYKLSEIKLLNYIQQSGIVGLGGAGFPTAKKIKNGLNIVNTLIINAAECEPYLTSSDRLIQEHSDEIIIGIQILQYLLKPKITLIGIEDNKSQAILALKKSLYGKKNIFLRIIPTKYPSGSSKQLIKILTGKEVPHGKHSSIIGILMQNIATIFAIKRAVINGEPLIERVITFAGKALSKPGNLWVRIGTSIKYLLNFVGFKPQKKPMIIIGGSLMGYTISNLNVPIIKINNCIIAPLLQELIPSFQKLTPLISERACIRCGLCTKVCPIRLLPHQLYWYSRSKNHEKLRKYHLFDCIECGACSFVCPSNIPLVQYYRQEKIEIKIIDQNKKRTLESKERYKFKLLRLEHNKKKRKNHYEN